MSTDEKKRNTSHVQSVAHSLMVIDYLAKENREISLTEISKALNWPKTTVHGLITTLRDYHYVDQSPITGHYRLGVRLFELGNIVAQSWDIRAIARPAMQNLNNRLGEMIQLATEDNGEVLYLDKLDSTHMMRIVSEVGTRMPMHCTGLGKVLLAYKNPSEVKWIIQKHGMPPMTTRTITNRELLKKELVKVKQQGYAIDDREVMDSLRCIAAPIYDRDGNVKYAASVSGIAGSLQGERFEVVRNELLRTADSISYTMGYRK